jgi:hypothetical protein
MQGRRFVGWRQHFSPKLRASSISYSLESEAPEEQFETKLSTVRSESNGHSTARSGSAQECPLMAEERKTFAHTEIFSV